MKEIEIKNRPPNWFPLVTILIVFFSIFAFIGFTHEDIKTEKVEYRMYRGINIKTGNLTHIYVKPEHDVYNATDTIHINTRHIIDDKGKIKCIVGVYIEMVTLTDTLQAE